MIMIIKSCYDFLELAFWTKISSYLFRNCINITYNSSETHTWQWFSVSHIPLYHTSIINNSSNYYTVTFEYINIKIWSLILIVTLLLKLIKIRIRQNKLTYGLPIMLKANSYIYVRSKSTFTFGSDHIFNVISIFRLC